MGGIGGDNPKHTAAEWRRMNVEPVHDWQVLPEAPATPDLTDELVQRARLAAIRRAQMGGALQSTFLTGSLGDTTTPITKKPSATGG